MRSGQSLTFDVEAQPGEIPLLLVSTVHDPLRFLNGALLVGLPPADALVLGSLPASGLASISFPVPSIGASTASLVLYTQSVFLDSAATVWLGAGTSVVLLDAGL